MSCFTYILFSKALNRFYIGHTCSDLQDQLKKHLSDHSGFTSKAKDWEIVYVKNFQDKMQAYKHEREIKSWKSKLRIQQLVQSIPLQAGGS